MRRTFILTAALGLFLTGCHSNRETGGHDKQSHQFIADNHMRWEAGPASLPPGAKMAVLEGDPAKPGFFTFRATLPDGYRIPPHWHPKHERVTVLSGTLNIGEGERYDASAATALPAGSYATMPPGMRHYAFAKGETVIQLSGIGPWGITYVNPDDDPRKAGK